MSTSVKDTYVLYHASCQDGAGSRFAAWKKFGDTAQYIPVQYNKPIPSIPDGKDVFILDFSYSKEVLKELRTRSKSLVVLDHHKTAKEDLKDLAFAVFDMNRSGAVMSWEYFHPDKPVPQILLHVQDRDLWRFHLDDTKTICAGLRQFREDMSSWDLASQPDDEGRYFMNVLRNNGRVILEYEQALVTGVFNKTKVISFAGYKVGIVNTTELVSEVGERIYSNNELAVDFSITFFITTEGKAVLSFRAGSGQDVSWIAKRLGGGGHATACGAVVSMNYLRRMLNNKVTSLPVDTFWGRIVSWFQEKFL